MTAVVGFVACVALGACSRASSEPEAAAPGQATIECAVGGAATFARHCAVERVPGAKGEQLVVRHPDGGFRRFDVLTDGKGLATADGAEAAQMATQGGGVEVTVGDDRYRFPATVVNHAGQ